MPATNLDLHGNAPDSCPVALLLIDVINDFAFAGSEPLVVQTPALGEHILQLRKRCQQLKIPIIYVNDNFGRWQSDFNKVLSHCLAEDSPGRALARKLKPRRQDYFVLKPKHSGFYSTSLDILLSYLQTQTLILTGLDGDICVLFTANDAYMRDFRLVVPSDCVISLKPQENRRALKQIQRVLKADIRPSTELDLQALLKRPPEKKLYHPSS